MVRAVAAVPPPSYRAPPPGDPRPASRGTYLALYAIGLVVYGVLAWSRLWHQSPAPHFVYQADAWLHGRVSIAPPYAGDDWAKVETVVLDDGREVRGRQMMTRPAFRTLGGELIPNKRVKQTRGKVAYMSFPPLPTLLMLPSALIAGRAGNDVLPTVLIAALILPLALLAMRRLAAAGLSRRRIVDDLWLVATLAFGTVLFFSAVQGEVWFTAHVVGVALALVYCWASIEGAHPIAAGVALGAAALTRTAMAFMFPLFVLEVWRMAGGLRAWRADRAAVRRRMVRVLVRFAIPIAGFAIAGMIYNYVRFGSPTEFGHTFLEVRQQQQIETYGLANVHYLARNLSVALTLLPELPAAGVPFQISGHGLALWITTPIFLLLLWPRERGPLHRALCVTALVVALPSLLYMNSGWIQFGYRFSLDYTVFLVLLLCIGNRPLTRATKALIAIGIAVNLFGAITFGRYWQFYRVNDAAYNTVIAN
jgi:hypothetical protein